MSASQNDSIAALNNAMIYINRYFAIVIFVFGCAGNILNILVLSQRNLRTNPCGWLFLTSSIGNLISLLFGLTTRILSGWNQDPTNTIDWICMLRSFVVFSSRAIALWLITFATIDRWLSSCVNVSFRRVSVLKNAQRISLIVVFLFGSIHLQIFYCYQANQINTPLKCSGKTHICLLVNDIMYAVVTILLPITLMFVFGLLTIINVQQAQRRIQTIQTQRNLAYRIQKKVLKKRVDRRLLKMLFVEILLFTLLSFPQAVQRLYSTSTSSLQKSAYNIAIDDFLYNWSVLLSFIASGLPFYVYTLSGGDVFRKALIGIFKC